MNLYKRNNGFYYIKFFDKNNKEVRISTKCKKKHDALIFLTSFKNNLSKRSAKNIIYLNKIKNEYLQFCFSRYTKKYYLIMASSLTKFSEYIGKIELNKITGSMCESFIMMNYHNAKYMSNLYYRNLRTFFNWAVENEYLVDSPMRKIKPPKVPTKNPEWLSESDLEIVLEKVKNKKLVPIYKLLFYTGLRANELLTLRWENIDIEKKIISIKNGNGFQTKTQIDRTLPINLKALKIFRDLNQQNKTGLIFRKNGIKLNVDYVSKQFKKAIRETNLNQHLHLHSLRHSFASNLIAKGASLYHVSKLLSHSRISTTEKYSHVVLNDLREVSNYI